MTTTLVVKSIFVFWIIISQIVAVHIATPKQRQQTQDNDEHDDDDQGEHRIVKNTHRGPPTSSSSSSSINSDHQDYHPNKNLEGENERHIPKHPRHSFAERRENKKHIQPELPEDQDIDNHQHHDSNVQTPPLKHYHQDNSKDRKNGDDDDGAMKRILPKPVTPTQQSLWHQDSIIGRALRLSMFSSSGGGMGGNTNSNIDVHYRPYHDRDRLAQVCEDDCSPGDEYERRNGSGDNRCLSSAFSFDPNSGCVLYPKSGRILQVFQKRRISRSDDDNDGTSNSHESSSKQNLPAKKMEALRQDSFVLEQAYQLVEPLHLELGVIPKHYLDYAYTPVMERGSPLRAPPPSGDEDNISSEDNVKGESADDDEGDDDALDGFDSKQTCKAMVSTPEKIEEDPTTSWWQWWFPSFTNPWWKDHHGSERSEHYNMHNTAFAGGSHGEVWRGRRVCNHRRKEEKEDGDNNDKDRANFDDNCDDRQPLILKRLNVARGYRLLEAGLREIYFGQLLAQERERRSKEAAPLVTVYVDHFFREVPRAFGRGRGHNVDLELWIVFEDAGPSLRSYLYEPVVTSGGFIMYQHSSLWTQLRMTSNSQKRNQHKEDEGKVSSVVVSSCAHDDDDEDVAAHDVEQSRLEEPFGDADQTGQQRESFIPNIGKELMRHVLHQILSAAAVLHESGIVHRDIKPSNVMCASDVLLDNLYTLERFPNVRCLLGDFSSGWDKYTDEHLYTKGPSPAEQTDEYAPPESYIGSAWTPFHEGKPPSYDSWSIGVLILELLLGTPNVFSVDQRTTVLLTRKMEKEGATEEEIQHALYLAALSQFCIYVPAINSTRQESWPLRHGDPLHKTAMAKESCTLHDFHKALRARDPLGIGFDSSTDLLLHLVWQLLAFDPLERISATEALQHPYFTSSNALEQHSLSSISVQNGELETQDGAYDPRLESELSDTVDEFICPKCGRIFSDWRSCHRHANMRRHAKFCTYDRSNLPTCINTHSMLPAHPTSGYCDLQGRRRVIEDFHSIHLYPSLQFYGIFDGHTGNLASKYAASILYGKLVTKLDLEGVTTTKDWKHQVQTNVSQAFHEIHQEFLVESSASYMDQSGTTATALLVTNDAVVVACLGDSRAVLSVDNDGMPGAFALTKDHVASDPIEQKLVEHRGGTISSSGGIPRVNGTLAITRSIGDASLAPLLSREPHVTSMAREEIRTMCGRVHCFVVLASDGLWDVLSNQEAVDLVSQIIDEYDATDRVSWNNGGAYQEAAEVLALEAYVRGSTDNIGVCVVAVD